MNNIKIKKIDRIKNNLEKNMDLLVCPKCHSMFNTILGNGLACIENHCYDIAKKGYINLLNIKNQDFYNKDLFFARNSVYSYGIYDKLFENIKEIIIKNINFDTKEKICVLDAGSGEGYLLNYLFEDKEIAKYSELIGVDISKEAIQIAAMDENDILWSVADLANLPIKENKVDIILNMLSPANYSEFDRIMKNDGIIIKVIPNEGYLHEIRSNLTGYIENDVYSNQKIVDKFKENMDIIEELDLNYSLNIEREILKNLLKMTPMTSKVPQEKIDEIMNLNIEKIQIDLKVLVGQKNISSKNKPTNAN